MPVKKFKPDWQPEGGEDMGLTGKKPEMGKDPVEFKERFKRAVIPEK